MRVVIRGACCRDQNIDEGAQFQINDKLFFITMVGARDKLENN